MRKKPENLLQQAEAHYHNGKLDLAVNLCRKILKINQENDLALHLLGVIRNHTERYNEAVDLIGKAITINPKNPIFYNNIGFALTQLEKLDQATHAYQKAIELDPKYVGALQNLAVLHHMQDQIDLAIEYYQKAINFDSKDLNTHKNLAILLQKKGDFSNAEALYQKALAIDPNNADLMINYASLLSEMNRIDEANQLYQKGLKADPQSSNAQSQLGSMNLRTGNFNEAIRYFENAIAINSRLIDAHVGLGMALILSGDYERALTISLEAIRVAPDHYPIYNNIGTSLLSLERFDEAISAYHFALEVDPNNGDAYNNIGTILARRTHFDDALDAYEKAIEINPNDLQFRSNYALQLFDAGRIREALDTFRSIPESKLTAKNHSSMIFLENYQPENSAKKVYRAHLRWAEKHAAKIIPKTDHQNSREKDRKLRIGYLSPDFKKHPVSFFMEGILKNHDRDQVVVTCYSSVAKPDDMTKRIRSFSDFWRNVAKMDDDLLAEIIADDGIDILVDLAGHTAYNRMTVLAHKPAPIQVTYLGYMTTTGMSTVDYRLIDSLAVPDLGTEEIIELPNCYLCFTPPHLDIPISALPSSKNDYVTFGSFNRLSKTNEKTIELWCKVLNAAPNSRFLIKTKGADRKISERVLDLFEQNGVDRDRIEFVGFTVAMEDHLAIYDRVDLVLDAFPVHGTTMTCEALWMGVPIITLTGDRHISRVGISILTNAGIPELIADDEENYVKIAIELAEDRDRLSNYNKTLRDRFVNSPICDAETFTRNLETEFRKMWQRWCDLQSGEILA